MYESWIYIDASRFLVHEGGHRVVVNLDLSRKAHSEKIKLYYRGSLRAYSLSVETVNTHRPFHKEAQSKVTKRTSYSESGIG